MYFTSTEYLYIRVGVDSISGELINADSQQTARQVLGETYLHSSWKKVGIVKKLGRKYDTHEYRGTDFMK